MRRDLLAPVALILRSRLSHPRSSWQENKEHAFSLALSIASWSMFVNALDSRPLFFLAIFPSLSRYGILSISLCRAVGLLSVE
jgi:hypothetical protein